jgi:hypothetical protein
MHTDQYLSFQSNHHLSHKRSVVRSLIHRANTIVTTVEDQSAEISHKALKANHFPDWAREIPKSKSMSKTQPTPGQRQYKPMAVIPYVHDLSEKLLRTFAKHDINKPTNTIRDHLVHPKDKTPKEKKCGVLYLIPCNNCEVFYAGGNWKTN